MYKGGLTGTVEVGDLHSASPQTAVLRTFMSGAPSRGVGGGFQPPQAVGAAAAGMLQLRLDCGWVSPLSHCPPGLAPSSHLAFLQFSSPHFFRNLVLTTQGSVAKMWRLLLCCHYLSFPLEITFITEEIHAWDNTIKQHKYENEAQDSSLTPRVTTISGLVCLRGILSTQTTLAGFLLQIWARTNVLVVQSSLLTW